MRKTYSRSHANRGAVLESLVDMANKQYRNKGVADIRKIPTPVQITGNNKGRISGFVTKGEWVDYSGIKDGRSIIFDAKETSVRTSFSLDNVSEHQYELLKSWHHKGALSFLIVSFVKLDETYRLRFEYLEKYWEGAKKGERKSIPHPFFFMNCDLVKSENGYVLHYLKNI